MKPHQPKDKEAAARLADAVKVTIDHLSPGTLPAMAYGIISRASRFFAYCPDDFFVQHADWYEGHAVFGGTNRLLWSMMGGFRPDAVYCSPKFLEQFKGEFWEPYGEIFCDVMEMSLVSSHHLYHMHMLPKLKIPTAWGGTHRILGRKSVKGDGKWAEIRLFTGFEAL